jgi:hypothetical protein
MVILVDPRPGVRSALGLSFVQPVYGESSGANLRMTSARHGAGSPQKVARASNMSEVRLRERSRGQLRRQADRTGREVLRKLIVLVWLHGGTGPLPLRNRAVSASTASQTSADGLASQDLANAGAREWVPPDDCG